MAWMPAPVRAVDDPVDGRLLVVAGAAPWVSSVRAVHPTRTTQYLLDPVEWDELQPLQWSSVVPDDLRVYRAAIVVKASALAPVELLAVMAGDYRMKAGGYYLWQALVGVEAVGERDLRRALASAWLREVRAAPVGGVRGIRLEGG